MALTIGDRGTAVRTLQSELAAAGFDPGGVDGVFGRNTLRAVQDFQRARGLAVDGEVGENTESALRRERNRDVFEPTRPVRPTPPSAGGGEGTAIIHSVRAAGDRNQQVSGTITVNGNEYTFRSGGFGRGNLPRGEYTVTPHLWSRSDRGMSVDGVGYSFAMSDKYDPRVGATRRLLRIHPDGGTPGTEGCMGIVGNGAVQRRFREDMRSELERNGGRYTLTVR